MLKLFENDYDRQSAIIDDKNKIIHNLSSNKSSNNQITQSNPVQTVPGFNGQTLDKRVLLIGDSIIKQIIPDLLLPRKYNYKVDKHEAYHIDDIPKVIHSVTDLNEVSTCIIHCRTNDIGSVSSGALVEKLKEIRSSVQAQNPDMKILISNITPRGDDHLLDISRQKFNLKLLKEFNNSQCVSICHNSNLSSSGIVNGKFYGQDKLHLNQVGTKVLAGNITSKLKSHSWHLTETNVQK